jgi:uncharacterized protein (DUF488 family)
MTFFTIGHSTRSSDELIALLKDFRVDMLIDVRSFPRSRRNPQFNADLLPEALAAQAIGYRHLKALGGRRAAQTLAGASPNGLWREPAFRNYADYALSPEFHEALESLLNIARDHSCAIMCAEADWRQCHRRIITDYLLATGAEAIHILGPDRREAARTTDGAEPQGDGRIHYPAAQGSLF